MRFPILLAALGLTLAGCQQKDGCTDPVAANYDAEAIEDDGSCAYAGCTNSDAWNFDAEATIDDGSCELPTLDGYTYKTVQIGGQAWFAENLRTTVYANGDPIPANLSPEEMDSADEGFTTVYGTDNGWDGPRTLGQVLRSCVAP